MLAKEEEISKLTTQLVQARLENTQLRQGLKRGQTPTNTYATTGAVRGAGGKSGRGSRRQRNAQGDQAYVAKRNQMCAKYNLGTCADTAAPLYTRVARGWAKDRCVVKLTPLRTMLNKLRAWFLGKNLLRASQDWLQPRKYTRTGNWVE